MSALITFAGGRLNPPYGRVPAVLVPAVWPPIDMSDPGGSGSSGASSIASPSGSAVKSYSEALSSSLPTAGGAAGAAESSSSTSSTLAAASRRAAAASGGTSVSGIVSSKACSCILLSS